MKLFTLVLVASVTAAPSAFAQRVQSCSDQARLLDTVLQRTSTATTRLSQGILELNQLSYSLKTGAQVLSGATVVDIRRELESSVSEVERGIRSAQSSTQAALADLRDTPNHGSYAYTLAGMAADKLSRAKQDAQNAERSIDTLKVRIDQVQQLVNGNNQLQKVRQSLAQGLQSVQRLEAAFAGFSELSRISGLARQYTAYCSSTVEVACTDIRSNLTRSADRLTDDGREVEAAAFDLRNVRGQVNQIVSGLGTSSPQFDLHTILHGVIHNNSLPYLQDGYNNMVNGESLSRQASTASSGVLHAQLVQQAIESAEKAMRLTNTSLDGLNSLRGTIGNLATQISNASTTNVSAFQLQQAASDTTVLARRSDLAVKRLGTIDRFGGDLGDTDRFLDDHRRYCEIAGF